MQITLSGNKPVPVPGTYHKRVMFAVHVYTAEGNIIEQCVLQFYHSQNQYPVVERRYKVDNTQPIKNLLFDENEEDFNLYSDMCRLIWPILSDEDEVTVIKLF